MKCIHVTTYSETDSSILALHMQRFGLPPLAQAVEAPPPEIIEEPVEPPVEATVPTEGPEPAVEPDPEVAPPPDEVPDNGTMTEAPKAAPPLTGTLLCLIAP